MKIYFACSITGGREDELIYQEIVEALLADGHEVPTALLATPEVMLLEGISVRSGLGAVSTAHGDEAIDASLDAVRAAFERLRRAGLV